MITVITPAIRSKYLQGFIITRGVLASLVLILAVGLKRLTFGVIGGRWPVAGIRTPVTNYDVRNDPKGHSIHTLAR